MIRPALPPTPYYRVALFSRSPLEGSKEFAPSTQVYPDMGTACAICVNLNMGLLSRGAQLDESYVVQVNYAKCKGEWFLVGSPEGDVQSTRHGKLLAEAVFARKDTYFVPKGGA